MDPFDYLAFRQLQAGVPDIFRVALSLIEGAVIFTVGTSNNGRTRRQVSGYNIRFLPLDDAPSTIMFDVDGASKAFANADIILSTGAPGPGGTVIAQSVSQFGKAGYYFASPVSQTGRESSLFAGPKLAPLPGSIVASATPPDVTSPLLSIQSETINGRSRRVLTFTATVPSNAKGVIAVNVLNPGSGYSGLPGATIPLAFVGNGTGATGVGILDANLGIGTALVTQTGNSYTSIPTVTAPPGSAVLEAILGDGTEFSGYQIYIDNYFARPLMESIVVVGANSRRSNSTMSGVAYLLPDTPPIAAHAVTFYFVSVSPTGQRRYDPTAAPSHTLAGGLV